MCPLQPHRVVLWVLLFISFWWENKKMSWQKILCTCCQETRLAFFSGLLKKSPSDSDSQIVITNPATKTVDTPHDCSAWHITSPSASARLQHKCSLLKCLTYRRWVSPSPSEVYANSELRSKNQSQWHCVWINVVLIFPPFLLVCFNIENWNAAAVWWGINHMYHTIMLSGDQKSKIIVQSFQSVPFQQ